MEISREEVTWLNKELPEWSKEYNEERYCGKAE